VSNFLSPLSVASLVDVGLRGEFLLLCNNNKTIVIKIAVIISLGSQFAAEHGACSSYRSISADRARTQQQTRRPPLLLSIEETDGHPTVTQSSLRILRCTILYRAFSALTLLEGHPACKN